MYFLCNEQINCGRKFSETRSRNALSPVWRTSNAFLRGRNIEPPTIPLKRIEISSLFKESSHRRCLIICRLSIQSGNWRPAGGRGVGEGFFQVFGGRSESTSRVHLVKVEQSKTNWESFWFWFAILRDTEAVLLAAEESSSTKLVAQLCKCYLTMMFFSLCSTWTT